MPLTLVTGGCGFIGRHVVQALLAQGGEVRVLDLAEPSGMPDGIDVRRGSILDRDRLADAMRGCERVYHVAGICHFWVKRSADFTDVNVGGTRAVLRAAAEAGVGRVVHCSTEVVLVDMRRRPGCTPQAEVLPPVEAMAGPYTRSKHAAEQAALAAARDGLDVVIASPTIPIGSGDRNLTPPAAMLARFLDGRAPLFLDCTLNLVGVRDLAAGLVLAGERGRRGERYVIGGENMRLRGLLAALARLSGRPMPSLALPGRAALAIAALSEAIADHVTGRPPPATREGVRLALHARPFESRKAREELGYRPEPVEKALSEAVAWLMADRHGTRPA